MSQIFNSTAQILNFSGPIKRGAEKGEGGTEKQKKEQKMSGIAEKGRKRNTRKSVEKQKKEQKKERKKGGEAENKRKKEQMESRPNGHAEKRARIPAYDMGF